MGVTMNGILKAADWSSESVFHRFYYKPTEGPSLVEWCSRPEILDNDLH